MPVMRELLRWAIFPALTIVPAWLGIVGVRAGIDDRALIAATVGGALLIQLILERLAPYRHDWGHRAKARLRADLLFLALATATGVTLNIVANGLGSVARGSIWPTSWPLAAQVVLAVAIADFGHYWAHRALHDVPALWRFHELHHRPDHLHALNFFRMHPVEIALKTLGNIVPLILLGATHEVLAVWSIISGVSAGSVNHANISMRTELFDGWFSTPRLHRMHHSRDPRDRGNLGNVTMIYDRLFGTHRRPDARELEAVGL
jgi:sterol desaturase/sphingolipid hydroxylase (fatty acid hydroxylase superfamily)